MEQHTSDQLAGTQGTSNSGKVGQCYLLCNSGHEYKNLAAHNRTLMHIRAAAKQPIPSSPSTTSVPHAPDMENVSGLAQRREGHHNSDPVNQDYTEAQERPMITTKLAVAPSTDGVILPSEAVKEGQCPALCREGYHYKDLVKHNQTKLHKRAMITSKLAVTRAPHDDQVILTSETFNEGQCLAMCRGGHHYKNLTMHNDTEAHNRAMMAKLAVLSDVDSIILTSVIVREGQCAALCRDGHHYKHLVQHNQTKLHNRAMTAKLAVANGDSIILTLETVTEGQCAALCRGGRHYRNLTTHNRTALHQRAMTTRSQTPDIAGTVGVSSAVEIPATPDTQTAHEGPCIFLCRNSYHYKNLSVHNRTAIHQRAAMKQANLSPAT